MSALGSKKSRLAVVLPAAVVALALTAAVLVSGPERATADAGPPLRGVFANNFRPMDPPVPAPGEWVEAGDGAEVGVADFPGRVVLVNFWATWCAPCIREMPSLDRLQAELGAEGLKVMAISEDRTFEEIDGFYAKAGLRDLEPYLDRRGKLARALDVHGLPTTVLVDRAGRVVGGMQGPAEWDSDDAKALLRWYLEREAAPDDEVIETSG